MRGFLLLVGMVVFSAALPVNAGKVYVCKSAAGETLFSQTPCPSEYSVKEERQVDTSKPSRGASEAELQGMADELSRSNDRIRVQRDLKNAKKKLTDLQNERERMIKEKSELAKSLAGPNARNRAQAIVDEMKTGADRYNEQIRQQRENISGLEKRLSEINQASDSAKQERDRSQMAI